MVDFSIPVYPVVMVFKNDISLIYFSLQALWWIPDKSKDYNSSQADKEQTSLQLEIYWEHIEDIFGYHRHIFASPVKKKIF